MGPVKFFFLAFFLLSFSDCTLPESENRRFQHNKRKQEGSRERNARGGELANREVPAPDKATPTDKPKPEPSAENLIFPVVLSSEHNSLSLSSSDSKKMSISAEPQNIAISLIAGLSGTFSFSTNEDVHILNISLSGKTLYFELNKANTQIIAAEGAVSQGQVLAETTAPALFYVRENEILTVLCFSNIADLSQQIHVIKNFSDHPDCS